MPSIRVPVYVVFCWVSGKRILRWFRKGGYPQQQLTIAELRGGKDSAGRQGQRSGGPTCGDPGAPLMAQMGRDLDDLGADGRILSMLAY